MKNIFKAIKLDYLKFQKIFYIFIFLNLFLTTYEFFSNLHYLHSFKSSKNFVFFSVSDNYPVYLHKNENSTNRSIIRNRLYQYLNNLKSLSFQINLSWIKYIKLFDFNLKYLYKKPLCLFSRPPPLISFN